MCSLRDFIIKVSRNRLSCLLGGQSQSVFVGEGRREEAGVQGGQGSGETRGRTAVAVSV